MRYATFWIAGPISGDPSDGFVKEFWLRGRDLNPRPLGYEPNELPDCSTPRQEESNLTTTIGFDQLDLDGKLSAGSLARPFLTPLPSPSLLR